MFGKLLFAIGMFALTLITTSDNTILADGPEIKWSPARQIRGYPSHTEPPYLVADHNRTVHAFHDQPINDRPAIVYSSWTMATGWRMPVDVLLAPNDANGMVMRGAFLDANGILHVIFVAGDDTFGGAVYYSRVVSQYADRATAWSVPKMIGEKARMGGIYASALAADDRGNLFVLYSGTKEGNGLYEVHSRDGGNTWSESIPVFHTGDAKIYPGTLGLLLENKDLHIAWSNWRPPYGGVELYYARLDTEQNRLSVPFLLSYPSTGIFTLPDNPSMIIYKGTLFLIYSENSDLANGSHTKLMRLSHDNGKSWTKPVWAFPPLIGGNGKAILLVDSNDRLHAVLANRTGNCCHGMWYSTWEGKQWSGLQAIINPEPKTRMFDPQIPQAVLSQGNVILAAWINEEKLNGVWYSYAKLDAPELPVVSSPIPMNASIPSVDSSIKIPTPPKASDSTRLPMDGVATKLTGTTDNLASLSILVGGVPVFILIVLIGIWRTRH